MYYPVYMYRHRYHRKSLEGMIRDQDLPIAFSQWLDQRLLRRVSDPTKSNVFLP